MRLGVIFLACATAAVSAIGFSAHSANIALSNAVATYDQPGFDALQMIDGTYDGANGWAINIAATNSSMSETALLTLASPLMASPQTLVLTIFQNLGLDHLLGDFELAYTTDSSPTLESDQTPFTFTSISSLDPETFFTSLGTGHVLAGGDLPATDTYTIIASVDAPITGIFIDAINDSGNGLPFGGPGRQPSDGNFVVSEFTVTTPTVPEPASWMMMILGLGATGAMLRRRPVGMDCP